MKALFISMLITGFVAPPAMALTMKPVDTRYLARASVLIIQGDVVKVRDAVRNGHIVREVDLRVVNEQRAIVKNAMKSNVRRGDVVTITLPGGKRKGLRVAVGDNPVFDVGDRVLVFLKKNEAGTYYLAGNHFGKYNVITYEDGQKLVTRDQVHTNMVGAVAEGLQTFDMIKTKNKGSISLSELLEEVEHHLR
jgi:hypothetical protein